ncbi:MAG TPA: DCC1-like thiol-disulfide oxidoreductase family protein [Thermoanaerobaculia bacterium]|nr:DCC1-like thiol-disulfide oxidoreductase family protein [Thermoanaerobaculia bacterium]
MRKLFILYDSRCGLCSSVRAWMVEQPAFFEIEFLMAGSDRACRLFPELRHDENPEELVVVTDEGDVYNGDSAWIMCLYALAEYRGWSFRLASGPLRPLARSAWDLISTNRKRLSNVLSLPDDAAVAHALGPRRQAACEARENPL